MIRAGGSWTIARRGGRAGERRDPGGIDTRRRREGGGRGPHRHRRSPGLYDRQDFNFVGRWDDNSFIEDYTVDVRGVPAGAVHVITCNADGEEQHIVVNYPTTQLVDVLLRLVAGEARRNAVRRLLPLGRGRAAMSITSVSTGDYLANRTSTVGTANGIDYAYRETGEGSTVLVLLHVSPGVRRQQRLPHPAQRR